MTDKTPRCSIVIRAYNEEKHIGRLLSGIMQQTEPNREIILVDSGSTDATVSIASQYPVRVVSIRPEEFTFGRSLNIGIEAARGEFIVIASAHIYPVYPDWLEKMLAPFANPQVALSYGKQRGAATTQYSEHQFFRQWFPDVSNSIQPHPFCNNANAAIRRELWQQYPYDETLTGLEDLAWAKWAMQQGHRIVYVPEAEIIHVHHESPHQVYNRFRREAMAFKHIFPDETFNLWDFVRLYVSNVVNDLWHATREGVLFANLYNVLWFRLMQFWGTFRGYHQSGTVTAQLRQVFYYPPGLAAKPDSARDVKPIDYGGEKDVRKREQVGD